MSERCAVCRGRKMIRLPLYRPVEVMDRPALAEPEPQRESRDYPCPECAPAVPPDRVRLLEHYTESDPRLDGDPAYHDSVLRHGAMALAALIERGGFIRVQKGAPSDDKFYARQTVRMMVGVVAPADAARIDDEILAKEEAFATKVLMIAATEIENWGSFYGRSEILKRDATRLLGDALQIAKKQRPKEVKP